MQSGNWLQLTLKLPSKCLLFVKRCQNALTLSKTHGWINKRRRKSWKTHRRQAKNHHFKRSSSTRATGYIQNGRQSTHLIHLFTQKHRPQLNCCNSRKRMCWLNRTPYSYHSAKRKIARNYERIRKHTRIYDANFSKIASQISSMHLKFELQTVHDDTDTAKLNLGLNLIKCIYTNTHIHCIALHCIRTRLNCLKRYEIANHVRATDCTHRIFAQFEPFQHGF